MNLLSFPSLVESPFVIVKIGDYTFGNYTTSNKSNRFVSSAKVTYPNYMQSLSVVKVNGAVNTYTIKMVYPIVAGADPNLLERVFGQVSHTRKIIISYGDWSSPAFVYREESAIITKVQSSVDFSGSRINYTLSCTSDSLSLRACNFDFPARTAKPSDVVKELLYTKRYGLLDVFTGMTDKQKVSNANLILGDDKKVKIEAKHSVNALDYLNYLVNCMSSITNTGSSPIRTTKYYLTIVDDVTSELQGTYFKITKVDANISTYNSFDTFEIDVGYPGDNFVTNFSLKSDEAWSILYNYASKISQSDYVYKIDDNGILTTDFSPNVTTSSSLMRTTEIDKAWWTQVTQFPISAILTIKGLLRPSILMSYVKLNVYFYGAKHISSGLYIITKQEDTLDGTGYKSTLTLTRVGGE